MMCQRRRRCPSNKPTLGLCTLFAALVCIIEIIMTNNYEYQLSVEKWNIYKIADFLNEIMVKDVENRDTR